MFATPKAFCLSDWSPLDEVLHMMNTMINNDKQYVQGSFNKLGNKITFDPKNSFLIFSLLSALYTSSTSVYFFYFFGKLRRFQTSRSRFWNFQVLHEFPQFGCSLLLIKFSIIARNLFFSIVYNSRWQNKLQTFDKCEQTFTFSWNFV